MTQRSGRRDEPEPDSVDDDGDKLSSLQRFEEQTLWVDLQIRNAVERGDFDNLPGAGKPIPGLGADHDPDWWTKRLIEREQIGGLAPPAIALRTEDAELDDRLDREASESEVRRVLADFNERVVSARRQLQGGPPVITATRDVDDEVEAWKARRGARVASQRRQLEQLREEQRPDEESRPKRRRWWRRG